MGFVLVFLGVLIFSKSVMLTDYKRSLLKIHVLLIDFEPNMSTMLFSAFHYHVNTLLYLSFTIYIDLF